MDSAQQRSLTVRITSRSDRDSTVGLRFEDIRYAIQSPMAGLQAVRNVAPAMLLICNRDKYLHEDQRGRELLWVPRAGMVTILFIIAEADPAEDGGRPAAPRPRPMPEQTPECGAFA